MQKNHESWNKVTKKNGYHRQLYRLTQNRNKLNSTVWSCCPKGLFSSIHRFMISLCKTLPQSNDNLMAQFNKKKGYEGIRTIKIFEPENTRSDVKKYCDQWEKRKAIVSDKSYIPTMDIYLQKLSLLLNLQMNQSFSVVFQF